jgi:hypothetical protein
MQRAVMFIACLGLLAGTAHAADETKSEDKVEVNKDKDHVKVEKKHKRGRYTDKTTVESKSRHRMGGGRVDETDTTTETDRPGLGHDTKHKKSHVKETDENGNVVREETKSK